MIEEDVELLKTLVNSGTYECIWKHLFYLNGGEWKATPVKIRNERYVEHKEAYCKGLGVDGRTLKHMFQIVAADAEERHSSTGIYSKFSPIEKDREETRIAKDRMRGLLNDNQKMVLDFFGSYDKAMNSEIVKTWLSYNENATASSIYNYYTMKK